jgi:uroporphyrinogen decarboxylase
MMKSDHLFLRACRREPVERPPVWIMRQAGRYLPEYRAVRARADFLTMVRTPELAVEVTLQPVNRLKVDAAIIFSDILVLPQAMGMRLSVEDGIGPRFHQPLRTPADFQRLRSIEVEDALEYVLAALRLARRELDGKVPLIGFAGGPWTLLSYMIEGGGSKTFSYAKRRSSSWPERWGSFWSLRYEPERKRCRSLTPGPAHWHRPTSPSSVFLIYAKPSGWRELQAYPSSCLLRVPGGHWSR